MKPLFSIWLESKKTFEFLEKRNVSENNSMNNTLFFFSSMVVGFQNSYDIYETFGGNYYLSLLISLILSGLVGVALWNFVFSYIFWGAGKLFKGKTSIDKIRLVFACSVIPYLILLMIGLFLIIPAIIMDKKELIGYSQPIIKLILWIIHIKIVVVGLTYFNKYSYLYAILTIVLPYVFMLGLIYGIRLLLM